MHPPKMNPENKQNAAAGCMERLVRRLRCALIGHRCYLWTSDEKTFLPVRVSDDAVTATCTRCGKTLSAVCAIYLPGMKYTTPKSK